MPLEIKANKVNLHLEEETYKWLKNSKQSINQKHYNSALREALGIQTDFHIHVNYDS